MDQKQKVILIGAAGRMGRTISYRFLEDGYIDFVAAVDPEEGGKFAGELTQSDNLGPEIYPDVDDIPADLNADLVLDFSIADATRINLEKCLIRNWDYLIGATGFNESDMAKFHGLAYEYNKRIVLVPNFTIGINLMLRFVREAARVYENMEIIELHHGGKIDAPSGTAIHTARVISEEIKKNDPLCAGDESRGKFINNIPVHSVRLPGLLAHQEVIFGGTGETLIIRHDTTNREAFLNGIYLAIDKISGLSPGFHAGLDWALNLQR